MEKPASQPADAFIAHTLARSHFLAAAAEMGLDEGFWAS